MTLEVDASSLISKTPSPVMAVPTTPASPSAPLADAMDEDETNSAVGSVTFLDTHTTTYRVG